MFVTLLLITPAREICAMAVSINITPADKQSHHKRPRLG